MLHQLTWHHCMWWDLPRLLPLYMQVHCGCVWSLYTSPGWEILLHEIHQWLPRKGIEKRKRGTGEWKGGKSKEQSINGRLNITGRPINWLCWPSHRLPIVPPSSSGPALWWVLQSWTCCSRQCVSSSASHCTERGERRKLRSRGGDRGEI